MTKMTRKWLAEWGFANSRGGLAASVVTQFCRSVGMPSIALDKASFLPPIYSLDFRFLRRRRFS